MDLLKKIEASAAEGVIYRFGQKNGGQEKISASVVVTRRSQDVAGNSCDKEVSLTPNNIMGSPRRQSG